jgi:hypothetical protein
VVEGVSEHKPGISEWTIEGVGCYLGKALEAPGMSTKTVMNWTSAGERTVKGWLSASSGPRGGHLIELM